MGFPVAGHYSSAPAKEGNSKHKGEFSQPMLKYSRKNLNIKSVLI